MLLFAAIPLLFCPLVLAWDLDDPNVSFGPAPAWVEPVEPPVGTPAPAGAAVESAQYLLVDDEVRVGEQHVDRYAHTTYRIVTRAGLDGLSQVEVAFDPSWGRVRVHHLRVRAQTGAQHQVGLASGRAPVVVAPGADEEVVQAVPVYVPRA